MSSTLASLKAQAADPGRVIVCLGPFVWGRGLTGAEAYRNARNQGVASYARKPYRFSFYDCPAGARVDGMGNIVWDDPALEGRLIDTITTNR